MGIQGHADALLNEVGHAQAKAAATMLARTRPDVIVHQMTALTGIDMKNIDKAFALRAASDRAAVYGNGDVAAAHVPLALATRGGRRGAGDLRRSRGHANAGRVSRAR